MIEQLQNTEIKFINEEKIELRDFFNAYYPVLASFAGKYISDKSVCEDIVQDVFISFWEKQKSFPNLLAAKGFFYTSIRNLCLDFLKHSKVEEKYQEYVKLRMNDTESFFDEILKAEAYNKVYEEINKLSAMGKSVMLLALKEKSNEEIALILNISINTVKTHKARSYRILRGTLKDLLLFILPFRRESVKA